MESNLINQHAWHAMSVQPHYSGKLKKLEELSRNMWWSWNIKAVELFKYIAGDTGISYCIDPMAMLKNTPHERFEELEKDSVFLKKYEEVYGAYSKYINTPFDEKLPSIAYFSMEYGLANILQIYSGGLGILAGDYLKEASDSRYDMVGVGLFYRQGYFKQVISAAGDQDEIYETKRFMDTPAELLLDENGETLTVSVEMEGRHVRVQVWEVKIGRIKLYLLDTDRSDNNEADRAITYRLYGGDNNTRLQQEIILGIGGVKVLNTLGIEQDIYHLNEGHAAFASLERLRTYIRNRQLTFNQALELVRSSGLFTTHTPVPAGHDTFTEGAMMRYMGDYPNQLGITWEKFINLGKENPGAKDEKYSMSVLAANTCREINGVSKLHGEVSRNKIFQNLWKGYYPQELHIGYVTNGVHFPTWASKDWQDLLVDSEGNTDFSQVYKLSSSKIWDIRQSSKKQLVEYINATMDKTLVERNENPKHVLAIKNNFSEKALTIGFARRFATYKRGYLLFTDLERLNKIVNNPQCPVQFVFAGKAHPRDQQGQDIIKNIVEISKRPEFIGKIIFVENYDISLAKELVKGVDIWLNTPTRPLEASGTSGMKGVMNGVLNFSVLDGWWVEGYRPGAGWALDQEKTYTNQDMQNEYDAAQIYETLEDKIIPLFYDRDEKGTPEDWVEAIKKCIAEIAPEFTMTRMINDYRDRFYLKLHKSSQDFKADNFKLAKEMAEWKNRIKSEWDRIELIQADTSELSSSPLVPGKEYKARLQLNINGLNEKDLGAEMIICQTTKESVEIKKIIEFQKVGNTSGNIDYEVKYSPSKPGSYIYAFRLFPKNEHLAHRQDCEIIRWI